MPAYAALGQAGAALAASSLRCGRATASRISVIPARNHEAACARTDDASWSVCR